MGRASAEGDERRGGTETETKNATNNGPSVYYLPFNSWRVERQLLRRVKAETEIREATIRLR